MVSVIFASGGSNVGAKSPQAKWIMPRIRRQPRDSPKFQSNNFSVQLHSSSRWRSLLRRRSRVSVVAMSIFEEMAGVELRSCPWFRRDFGDRLQIHRAASRSRIDLYSIVWGKDVRPPTYFWARRWFLRMLGLIYLIAFVSLWVQVDGLVGSNGMSPVSQFLPAVRAATWARRLFSFADTLLVRLEQRLSTFPLRWRRCSFVAFDFRNRAGAFTRRAFCLLPVAHDCWTSVSQLSMGRSPA